MLCLVQHEWPSCALFISTPIANGLHLWSIHHISALVVTLFKVRQEGVTPQGDPVTIVANGLSTLPLICQLKTAFPEKLQYAGYADDSAVAGSWMHVSHHFHCLQQAVRVNLWQFS